MKKLALSGALAAIVAIPALGIEVYSNEEKGASVELYGSLRGFVGGGGITSDRPANSTNDGSYIIGFQNNSHFGINSKYGKLFTKVEFGLREQGILGTASGPGLRKVFGTYDFGSGGKLTFGKIDTPTIEGGFQTDFNNNDAGGNGFGSVTTGSRKLQIQYSHSGATIAIIHDDGANSDSDTLSTGGAAYTSRGHSRIPRIALSYEGKIGEKGKFKVAATYKYFDRTKTNLTLTGHSGDVHAGHLLVGAKVPLGNAYLSTIFTYGINGHTYGEQQTAASAGGYGYTINLNSPYDAATNPDNSLGDIIGLNAQRAGLLLEGGAKINDTISLAAGVGYQATFNGENQRGNDRSLDRQAIHSYKVYANLPINVAKGFQIVPQLGFYDVVQTYKDISTNTHRSALVGLVRLKYDF